MFNNCDNQWQIRLGPSSPHRVSFIFYVSPLPFPCSYIVLFTRTLVAYFVINLCKKSAESDYCIVGHLVRPILHDEARILSVTVDYCR